MKVQKIVRAQGEFAKPNVDYKDKDVLTILDGGQIITGTFGDQTVFKMKTTTGEKNMSFNQTSMNNLIDEMGEDTDLWVGKEVKVWLITQSVSGQMRKVCYLTATDWDMIEDAKGNMKFAKVGEDGEMVIVAKKKKVKEEVAEEEIPLDGIPF
jgi:hypothetical protein